MTKAPSRRGLVLAAAMIAMFMSAIESSIISTAMPTIVARLGGLELYSWVFSIYMLTSALTTPIFGKLADLYSRRRLMLVGIGIFLVGIAIVRAVVARIANRIAVSVCLIDVCFVDAVVGAIGCRTA
mgnify:CR=1 FL=1